MLLAVMKFILISTRTLNLIWLLVLDLCFYFVLLLNHVCDIIVTF